MANLNSEIRNKPRKRTFMSRKRKELQGTFIVIITKVLLQYSVMRNIKHRTS